MLEFDEDQLPRIKPIKQFEDSFTPVQAGETLICCNKVSAGRNCSLFPMGRQTAWLFFDSLCCTIVVCLQIHLWVILSSVAQEVVETLNTQPVMTHTCQPAKRRYCQRRAISLASALYQSIEILLMGNLSCRSRNQHGLAFEFHCSQLKVCLYQQCVVLCFQVNF